MNSLYTGLVRTAFKTMALLLAMYVLAIPVQAQDRLPVREFTHPDDLVSISEDMPLASALELLGEFAERSTQKILIDRSDLTGSVGIEIPQMHWMDALQRIVAWNGLTLVEHARYFEVVLSDSLPVRPGEQAAAAREAVAPMVQFGSREIEIKATFFEGNRQTIRELGIDWSSVYNGRVRVDHTAAARLSEEAISVDVQFDDFLGSGLDITALFRAMESSNKGEVIASPTIKVLEGERGRIQVGQDFSIRQRDFAGNVIDQFYSTGTILQVDPVIYYHEGTPFIYMSVLAERSTASPGSVSTIVNKQEASTEVLLLSGETTVIAGLYETEENKVRRGIPLLKDLPGWFFGLRYVFGYHSVEYSVQELVIVLQASLVPSLEERLRSVDSNR